MIVIRKKPASRGEAYALKMPGQDGLTLRFQHGYLGDNLVFAAHVPDDHPSCRKIRDRMGSQAAFRVVTRRDDDMQWDIDKPPPVAAPVETPGFSENEAIALARGWSLADLIGTGEGSDPGPRGGRSARSGLWLAQMQLSSPPEEWETRAETHYPWECADWKAPGIGFAPPSDLPSKRDDLGDTEGAIEDPEEESSEEVAEEVSEETPSSEDLLEEDSTGELSAVGELPSDLTTHMAVMRDLAEEGQPPALSKLRYHLKKDGLSINQKQYEQLISLL